MNAEEPGATAAGDRSVAAETISGHGCDWRPRRGHARTLGWQGRSRRRIRSPSTAPVNNLPRPRRGCSRAAMRRWACWRGALAAGASAVVTQAVYGLGGVGKSELALQHAARAPRRLPAGVVDHRRRCRPGRGRAGRRWPARLCPEVAVAGTTRRRPGGRSAGCRPTTGGCWSWTTSKTPAMSSRCWASWPAGMSCVTTRRDVGLAAARRPGPARRAGPRPPPPRCITAAHRARQPPTTGSRRGDRGRAGIPAAGPGPGRRLHRSRPASRPAGTWPSCASTRPACTPQPQADAQRTIARLWDITIHAIRGRDPGAVRLLQVLARYAPDNIPRTMLGGHGPRRAGRRGSSACSPPTA